MVFRRRQWDMSHLRCIYFDLPKSFPEITEFANLSALSYGFTLFTSKLDFRSGLHDLLQQNPTVKGIFLGTRRDDPRGGIV